MTDRSYISGRVLEYIRAPALIDRGGRPNLVTPCLSPGYLVSFPLFRLVLFYMPVNLPTKRMTPDEASAMK